MSRLRFPSVLLLLLAVTRIVGAGETSAAAAPMLLQAGCSEPAGDDATSLFSVIEPAGATAFSQISGAAPLTVALRIERGVIVFPAGLLTTSIDWGDGSGAAVAVEPCGEDEYQFSAQTLRHTYSATQPNPYQITWTFQIPGFGIFPIPVLFVEVTQATPPTATPSPTPSSVPAPTATPGSATPSPVPTERTPQGTPGTASSPTPIPAATTPGPSPSPSPIVATPVATATASPTPTPTATATPGVEPAGSVDDDDDATDTRPEINEWVRGPDDVSTDMEVVATNIVIAGFTVWVFFSSIFLDEVLSDRREVIEARFRRATRRLRRSPTGTTSVLRARRWWSAFDVLAVLVITAAVYGFLQPRLEWNRATATLLLSAAAGIGITTVVCDGLQALAIRRWTGTPAAIRAYPAAIGIAIASVAVSRALDLSPGVIYGFAASCAALAPLQLDRRLEGRLSAVPLVAGLVLAVGGWLAVGAVRAMDSDSFAAIALESTLVVIFIGGIESLAISLIPAAATDGGKVFRWSRRAWVALAAIATFLVWHVLLGREREYFSGLREATSLTVLAVFVVYTALIVGLWVWLRRKTA